jgi:hypothetical protein
MTQNIEHIRKRDGIARSIYESLSQQGVFLPNFNSSAITAKNLMKATQEMFFSPFRNSIHELRLIPRNELQRSLKTCYFHLFYLVQVKTHKTLPWGISIPNYDYVENLLQFFDPTDKLKLRQKYEFRHVDFVFKKTNKKKSKLHRLKRGFSGIQCRSLRKLRNSLSKFSSVMNSFLDSEVERAHISRLFLIMDSKIESFLESNNLRTLIDPILSEYEKLKQAFSFQTSLESDALTFVQNLDIFPTDSDITKAQTAYLGVGIEHYLDKDDLQNEGDFLDQFGKYGLTKTGLDAMRTRRIHKIQIKNLYKRGEEPRDDDLDN